jgi:hypothetical protein
MNQAFTRRSFLQTACCGMGGLALAALLHEERVRANPLAARPPHRPAKARAVIFLFMAGGPSHLETFDPKPFHRTRRSLARQRAPFRQAWPKRQRNLRSLSAYRSFGG